MKRSHLAAAAIAVSFSLGLAASAFAQQGPTGGAKGPGSHGAMGQGHQGGTGPHAMGGGGHGGVGAGMTGGNCPMMSGQHGTPSTETPRETPRR